PGDGARPLGDGGPGPAADFQVTGKAFDVRAARLEQAQVVLLHQFAYWRRSRAYASWVKPVYPAQNPGQRQVSEHRLGRRPRWTRAMWWWSSVISRVGLRPRGWASRGPSDDASPHRRPTQMITQGHHSDPGRCPG